MGSLFNVTVVANMVTCRDLCVMHNQGLTRNSLETSLAIDPWIGQRQAFQLVAATDSASSHSGHVQAATNR